MSRTDTTRQTTFNLPPPRQAIFEFSRDPTIITITVPRGSGWRLPLHWHSGNALGCISVRSLIGRLRVYIASDLGSQDRLTGPSTDPVTFKPGEMVTWSSLKSSRRPGNDTEEWAVEFRVVDGNLYRNTCSAVQDREIYPQLSSTPLWLRFFFGILRRAPRLHEALLSLILWIQIQTILYANDFHEYHGYIPLTWPWVAQIAGGVRPPRWVRSLQRQTFYWISGAVMATCYWLGRLLLGMKGSYPEYTVSQQELAEALRESDKPDEKGDA